MQLLGRRDDNSGSQQNGNQGGEASDSDSVAEPDNTTSPEEDDLPF